MVWDITEAKEQLRHASRKRTSGDDADDADELSKTVPQSDQVLFLDRRQPQRPVGTWSGTEGMEVSPRGQIDDPVENGEVRTSINLSLLPAMVGLVWDLHFQLAKKRCRPCTVKPKEMTNSGPAPN